MCHDPEYPVYVAREGGRALGVIVLQRRGVASSPYVRSIAVDLDARGRGVGKALASLRTE